ncbi:MAG: radical SAM/SPASM domain-containing protein [Candidatus Caldatribacteriaceae bacterium]
MSALRNHFRSNPGIGALVITAVIKWGLKNPWRAFFLLRIMVRVLQANARRAKMARRVKGVIPVVLAISPTMKCNYTCLGCYSRGRNTEDELSFEELDALFREAETLGIASVVVTGGEPFSRGDFIPLLKKHPKLLFVVITNGSYFSPILVREVAQTSNLIVLVSIEGGREETERRRGEGSYHRAIQAMTLMRKAKLLYGFAVTTTRVNIPSVLSRAFLDTMRSAGCVLGFFTEYVPCGETPQNDWMISQETREKFRERVLRLRKTKCPVIIQFPHDEYGEANICSGAGRGFFHINPQGNVEPCPFSPYSCDNIRSGGLRSACNSLFRQSIRNQPELLERKREACALFEHQKEIEKLCIRILADAEKGEAE